MKNDTNNQPGSVGWGCVFQRTAGGAELLHQLWQCGRYGGVGCPRRRDSAAADGGTGASGKQHRPRHAADICQGADRLCRTDYRPERGTYPETSDAFPLVPVLLLLAFSACGLTIAVVLSRRRKR